MLFNTTLAFDSITGYDHAHRCGRGRRQTSKLKEIEVKFMQEALQFSVNIDSPIAVYVQIENQVMFAVASKRLSAGERVPSARDMSAMLDVNANTVIKAYRDLELMGIVNTRRGVGVTVTDGAYKIAHAKATQMVGAHLRETVGECVAVGMKPSEIRAAVSSVLEGGGLPYVAE